MKCPKCKKEKDVIKHGTYKGIQRYKCKHCNITFRDKDYTYKSMKEKEIVQTLYNLLTLPLEKNQHIYRDIDLSKLINKNNLKNAPEKIAIQIRESTWKKYNRISCQNPKAILCLYEGGIRVVSLSFNNPKKTYRFTMADEPTSINQVLHHHSK